MSCDLFPAFERKEAGLEATAVDGRALGPVLEELDELASQLGVAHLESFYDEATMAEQCMDPEELEGIEVPPVQWFPAAEGLVTVRALRDYLVAHPNYLPDSEYIINDLNDTEAALAVAEQHQIRFHFLLDV